MPFPTPSEYQEAVQFPATVFADPDLREATPETNALGLPQPVTGAFAAVFPMRSRTCTWAAKCFLTEVAGQRRRYRAVARHLEAHVLPYTAAFEYQEEGIRVGGTWWPLLKMEWVEGKPLNRFVEAHVDDPQALHVLADRWRAMLADLEDAQMAHGDLQHGNVLVAGAPGEEVGEGGDLRLRLVDYDAAYVPALRGRGSPEVGHRNYQHPDRDERDFGLHVDRFAALAVHVALRAVAARPTLWRRYDTGENVLFRAADFYDPEASPLFDELLRVEAVRAEAEVLRAACYGEPKDVPSLEHVLSEEGAAGAHVEAVSKRRRTSRKRRGASERAGVAWWFLPALMGALIACVAVGVGLDTWAALAALVPAVSVLGTWAARGYRRQPVVRRRRRLRQEIRSIERVMEQLQRQIASLRGQQQGARATVERRAARRLDEVREEALYDRLKHHFIGEVEAVEGVTHRVVVRLKAAGIRTAHAATPEALRNVREVGQKARARVAMWRAALVAEYAGAIPDALSPAEVRRIERYVEQRLEHAQRDIRRAEAKRHVQAEERAQVQRRLEDLPALTPARYVRYLLRLGALPRLETPPPPTAAPPRADGAPAAASHVPHPEAEKAAERPWWEQTA